jgi:phosphoserine phosphatase
MRSRLVAKTVPSMIRTCMGTSQRWAVVAVDLDGTLIHGTTACLLLGAWMGHLAVIEDLERRFAAGEIANADVADGDAPYYKGRSMADVSSAMAGAPWIDDIHEGVEQLASRGVDALLCTVTWSFAAQCVADRFGFSAVSGTVMKVDGAGILTGRVAQYFEPEDKVAFLRDYCDSRDLSMHQVVAIGDGRSDLPMFEAAGFSVGLNASSAARAAASASVDSHSFLDALHAVPGLLSH